MNSTKSERRLLTNGSCSKRPYPRNLNPKDLQLFTKDIEYHSPDVYLHTYKDVMISPRSILHQLAKPIQKSFISEQEFIKWQRLHRRIRLAIDYLSKNETIHSDTLWITDRWSHNYFHWLLDSLPRLWVVEKSERERTTLALPAYFEHLTFVKPTLDALGIKKVIYLPACTPVKIKTLHLPSHVAVTGNYNENVINQIRSILAPNRSFNEEKRLIYISRGRAATRKTINEDEVVKCVTKFGFEILIAENHDFNQQRKIFSQASAIIGNHGAGLANMLFAPKGCQILEFRRTTADSNNCYYSLASALGHNYFYQSCDIDKNKSDNTTDFTINIEELTRNIKLMIMD